MKRMIWSNNYDAVKEKVDFLLDENDALPEEERLTEDEAWMKANELIMEDLHDERFNLDIDVGYPIVAFASLQLWNGRKPAFKQLDSQNLRDVLDICCGDYIDWYVDENGEMIIRDTHHDGTNTYTLRVMRGGMSVDQINNFWRKLWTGKLTWNGVKRYTRRLGDYPANVYGWKLRGGVRV